MDSTLAIPSGSPQAKLIDQEIAHIARVMHVSLRGDFGGPILPASYWRKRLGALLDIGELGHAQLCKIDSLLLQLQHLETTPQGEWAGFTPPRPAKATPSRRSG
ncbi:hypothetical protein BTH42_04405 [Burkholderia sp. SRS-W-2-2016]|uniref:hypothetical protein n=1 Tax=Burkholderia sp. SRS-W-2-2016 TaxID=1926878 RepID=UPI00094B0C2D|nr:hypothetical protein [Burkholderia sp. SRS-W-2-2016]OLL32918.1 hypothetical protein BTH42_04405 [Burkholderia sp. SRS-W-2-2016]